MTGHGAKFPRKKEAAIAALLTQRNVEEAARAVDIGTQTLYRWMKEPEFEAAYRKARCAVYRQAIGRLQQASGAAVAALLKVAFDPDAPASARLAAADGILSGAKAASEIEEFGARVSSEVKRFEEAAKPARKGDDAPPAAERGRSPIAGHGAKFPRKKKAAIVALLMQRSVEEAARVTGIGTQTLYRWMRDPEFDAACVEARLAAFGQAGARLQQASGAAVTVIQKIMADPGTSARAHVRAARLVHKHARDASEEDLEIRLAECECAAQAALAVLPGGRGPFDEIARERPKEAA
jgi:transposase-like protein